MNLRNLINRLRGRPSGLTGRDQSERDWSKGDLGVCIGDNQWLDVYTNRPRKGPALDELVKVRDVAERHGFLFLRLEGNSDWFTAQWFKKLRPNQREACDFRFRALIKSLRPKVGA